MSGLYNRYVMPRVVSCLCGTEEISAQRAKVVPAADGVVLEVGIGPGHNLGFYDRERVSRVIGLDPVREMTALGARRFASSPVPVEVVEAPAEDMPLDDGSVDTVLLTYTACTIPDTASAVAEMRRVLKPGGRLLFCEHGRSRDEGVARWQDRVNPLWSRLAGGCNINRNIAGALEEGGFEVVSMENYYLKPMPRIVGYHYLGSARAR
ncbi:class I SAM-dependent methyltransferase [Kaustia mangrovi]|uniref:Class I SAM-dependent methyltransferase n=1 Tax=Kaustia mangrovi TaxID=2593653 RepID=A0A7S8C1T0_9HYPH|nr:class I SAM-dependent methyltransferase [Kaustia mangrovi]QPC41813.1 class I SAM-dependent methyltransferase [Kaustia mangrovi]